MSKVKFVISTELIRHKFKKPPSLSYLKDRVKLFKKFTLISILKQTCQDFDIWIFCDKRFKDYMSSIVWDEKIKIIYDDGVSILNDLDVDHLAIMRTDSDDLLHKNCMQEIKDRLILCDRMHRLVFYQMFTFDIISHALYNRASRTEAPFFTNIYPKKLYKNHDYFVKTLFGCHHKLLKEYGDITGYIPPRVKMKVKPEDRYGGRRICVLNHSMNYSNLRKGIKVSTSKTPLSEMKKIKNFLTNDKKIVYEMLKDFNIKDMI